MNFFHRSAVYGEDSIICARRHVGRRRKVERSSGENGGVLHLEGRRTRLVHTRITMTARAGLLAPWRHLGGLGECASHA